MTILTMSALENMTLKELYEHARQYKIAYYAKMSKKELIFAILKQEQKKKDFSSWKVSLKLFNQKDTDFFVQ